MLCSSSRRGEGVMLHTDQGASADTKMTEIMK